MINPTSGVTQYLFSDTSDGKVAESGISRESFHHEDELSSTPSHPYNPIDMIEWVFERSFHNTATESGVDRLYKVDGTTILASGLLSDNGTIFERNKYL